VHVTDPSVLSRRDVLTGLIAGAALACTGAGEDTKSGETDLPVPLDSDALPAGGWATGGTASLAETYPVDFTGDCAQTCELTLGPCYGETIARRDISEGVDGLPTRMAFRVVDVDCSPVAGAEVDVWHCSPSGLCSGAEVANMCTSGDAEALAANWFRGVQTTDADGRVDLNTCLPGWYPGRAVHIHFQVRVGGQSAVVSQLGFPEALLADVFANHPAYSARGQADTPNRADNILNRDLAAYLFGWEQAPDGALVVWKTLVLRRSTDDPAC
jgi:protocatechuate 3,4-dioxygenase beta subunit